MKQLFLWTLAVILTIAAVIYQRSTGPTYPFKGKLTQANKEFKYKLLRSQETTEGARITLPTIDAADYQATLHFKRYKTMDSITPIAFEYSKDMKFEAQLPIQPAAGKMEYYITGTVDGKTFRIPEEGEKSIVLRYKDPVPGGILIPHIFFMFFAVLFGLRAGLSALFDTVTMRKWVIISLTGMTIGGMMLGPLVQKNAFGEYWTGFPYGGDFTDNKTLIMWFVWVLAIAIIGLKPKKKELVSRIVVLVATIVMTSVYLIPHSMGGSTLDYSKVDQGIKPSEAIETGKH
ncbi:MAG: hypothetical protein IT220_02375 [Flavobacteriaceae bacterium]|nr:hypothetical protein [Flavobacteriaceae bacterium]